MKKPEYTLGPGRTIERDGKPFAFIGGEGAYRPYELDRFAHRIVHLLNAHGFVCEPAFKKEEAK